MTVKHILIIIADGEHARFVRPAANHSLHTVESFDSISAHQRTSDMGNDAPGASYHTGSTAHHALNPHHDPHRMAMETFGKFVAEQINEWSRSYDRLLIVAPPHSSAEIVRCLDPASRTKVIDIVHKDLVKTPDNALKDHLNYIT